MPTDDRAVGSFKWTCDGRSYTNVDVGLLAYVVAIVLDFCDRYSSVISIEIQ